MTKFNGYKMTGKTSEDCKAIMKHVEAQIELTIDEIGRVYNEGGQYIADAVETDEGNGILCYVSAVTTKYRMNRIDENGNILTGYEEILEGTKEECISDYCYHHEFDESEVLAELVDWE